MRQNITKFELKMLFFAYCISLHTKNAILFYEFEYKNTCYTICAKKYNVLFKPAKPRRSRNYHLFKALLKSLDDNTCVYNKDDSTKDA